MEPQQYSYPPTPPAPEKPAWSTKKTTAVTAVAAAAVLAIGGVAVANSGADSGSSTSQGPGGGTGRGGFPGGGAVQGGGLTGALHGTYVAQADGSYVTRVFQTGEVMAASETSITVKSTDGYTKSYTVSSSTSVNGGQSTAADVETGHPATVTATESAAATSILDQSLAGTGSGGFPGGAPGQDGSTGQGDGTTT